MSKQNGFIVTAKFFVPIDKTDFAKQRDAFALMADIQDKKALSPEFLAAAEVLGVTAKQGGRPDAAAPGDANTGK